MRKRIDNNLLEELQENASRLRVNAEKIRKEIHLKLELMQTQIRLIFCYHAIISTHDQLNKSKPHSEERNFLLNKLKTDLTTLCETAKICEIQFKAITGVISFQEQTNFLFTFKNDITLRKLDLDINQLQAYFLQLFCHALMGIHATHAEHTQIATHNSSHVFEPSQQLTRSYLGRYAICEKLAAPLDIVKKHSSKTNMPRLWISTPPPQHIDPFGDYDDVGEFLRPTPPPPHNRTFKLDLSRAYRKKSSGTLDELDEDNEYVIVNDDPVP